MPNGGESAQLKARQTMLARHIVLKGRASAIGTSTTKPRDRAKGPAYTHYLKERHAMFKGTAALRSGPHTMGGKTKQERHRLTGIHRATRSKRIDTHQEMLAQHIPASGPARPAPSERKPRAKAKARKKKSGK